MKGLQWHLLASIILVVLIVFIGMFILLPVAGFDVKKYFGIGPILGEPGEISYEGPTEIIIESHGVPLGAWYCANWQNSQDRFAEFSSPNCPSETYAASCGTFVDTSEIQYSHESIVDIYIDNNRCVVHAFSPNSPYDHRRNVCILCLYEEPVIEMSDFIYGTAADDHIFDTSPDQDCSGSKNPIFCPTEVAGEGEDDPLREIYADPFNQNPVGCHFWSWGAHVNWDTERKIGSVCIDSKYRWYFSDKASIGINVDPTGTTCPGDMYVLSCLSHAEDGTYFEIADLNARGMDDFGRSVCEVRGSQDSGKHTASALCAENFWNWTNWIKSEGNSDDVAEMESGECPDGMIAISCATQLAGELEGTKYSEDVINSLYIDGKKCKGAFRDTEGDDQHKRAMGVLCVNDDYSGDFQTTGWVEHTRADDGETVTWNSPQCNSGFRPIFCMVKADLSQKDIYGDDGILSIKLDDEDNPTRCEITMRDVTGGNQFKVELATVCAKEEYVIIEGINDLKEWDEDNKGCSGTFNSRSCIGIATMPITDTPIASGYWDDPITTMVPVKDDFSDPTRFLIQAWDLSYGELGESSCGGGLDGWWDGSELKRKNGVVCLNLPEEAFESSSTITWTIGIGGGLGEMCANGLCTVGSRTVTFNYGDPVTLLATPDTGYVFDSFQGGDPSIPPYYVNPVTFPAEASGTISAYFVPSGGGPSAIHDLGDVNDDCIINEADLTICQAAYDSSPGDPSWNPDCDFDSNGYINIMDIQHIGLHYLLTCATATCADFGGTCDPVGDCTGSCYCSNCLDCTTYPARCCCIE